MPYARGGRLGCKDKDADPSHCVFDACRGSACRRECATTPRSANRPPPHHPPPHPPAGPRPSPAAIDADDIRGTVTSRFGPEAGVWVVAETQDLGTRFAKMAVTDERGRYVIPDLPKANYQVWVRGYGLVDSPKVAAEPGKMLDLTAVVAP